MTFQEFIFWFFSAILIFAALRVITARNPVHAALFLVLAFCTAAGLWIQLEAEFLGIALVLVYVGAVMVLFLFVVMMLDINIEKLREGFWSYLPVGATVALLLVVVGVLYVSALPDGFDSLAERVGVASRETALFAAPLADYEAPFVSGDWARKALAGVAGLAVIWVLCLTVGRLLLRQRSA